MADFKPTKFNLSTINNGKGKYNNGDGVQADTINAVVEGAAWVQALGTNQPNNSGAGNVGTPSVSIETLPDGTPRFKFDNLKGGGGSGTVDAYTKAETDELLNAKQDDLTQTQLNAVNSGITATKVSTYDNYATAINNKVDKVTGKGLSTNDFTTAEKTKLAGIEYVKANPTESGTTTLTKLKVGNTVYNVPQGGGGGGGTTVVANPTLTGSETSLTALQVGDTKYGIKALKVTIW